MADDSSEGERTITTTESAADPETAADSFLELEGHLEADEEPPPRRTTGLVVDAETVPADRVPSSYPLDVATDEVLALTLELDGRRETTTYLEWPADGTVDPDSRLGHLLAATGVAPDAFADLYGREVLLERVGGQYTVYVPPERPQGTGDWALGVAGGLAFNVAVLGLAALAAAGVPLALPWTLLTSLFLLVNVVLLPVATYRDATYLRSHSDWEQGPPFWAALSMVPGLNVAVSALYLRSRKRAGFLGDEPSLTSRLVRRVRDLV